MSLAKISYLRDMNMLEQLARLVLPKEILDYFDIVKIETEESDVDAMSMTIHLDERMNAYLQESDEYESKGFMEPVSVTDFLYCIISAMKRKVRINVTYQKYGNDECSTATFAPYCLRLFQCRWYVLGQFQRPVREGETPTKRRGLPKDHVEYFATYSLDRVKEIELTEEKFNPDKNFSASDYFKDCFGVYNDTSVPVQKVVLRAYGLQRFYMRDLPWHHSQKEVYCCDEYADFEFTIRPTSDFIRYIMRYGNLIKVISPVDVAKRVRTQLLNAADMYKELDDQQ